MSETFRNEGRGKESLVQETDEITRRNFFTVSFLHLVKFAVWLPVLEIASDTDRYKAIEQEWGQIQPPLEDVIRVAMEQMVKIENQLQKTEDNDLKEILKKLMSNFREQQDLATEIISKFPMLNYSLLQQLKILQEENSALMRQYESIVR